MMKASDPRSISQSNNNLKKNKSYKAALKAQEAARYLELLKEQGKI